MTKTEKYIHKLDVSDFAYRELGQVRDLINLYMMGKENREVDWFVKKIVSNDLIPKVCLVDDDNNYYGIIGELLFKLSDEEKKAMQWNGSRYEGEKN